MTFRSLRNYRSLAGWLILCGGIFVAAPFAARAQDAQPTPSATPYTIVPPSRRNARPAPTPQPTPAPQERSETPPAANEPATQPAPEVIAPRRNRRATPQPTPEPAAPQPPPDAAPTTNEPPPTVIAEPSPATTQPLPESVPATAEPLPATPVVIAPPNANANSAGGKRAATADEAQLQSFAELAATERIIQLKQFIEAHPASPVLLRAREMLVAARAASGEEKMQAGERANAVEQFRLALSETPAEMSDELFARVVAQIPLSLYARGERDEALRAAAQIADLVKDSAPRLLVLTQFYLQSEEAFPAVRTADAAIKLAPENAAAHQALGAAWHLALRLDEAAAEYARALALDPNSAAPKRSLADIYRALGKSAEALQLYRAVLKDNPKDATARAGLVIALFDAGQTDEGERELAVALKDDPKNLALLAGMGYWFAAHKSIPRALDYAQRAVRVEPRYTWAQVALARALVGGGLPLEAERALRLAQTYGRFPTLDYELANALAAAGLYNEAAQALAQSFSLKDGNLQARLAGRYNALAEDFTTLTAAERHAAFFQFTAADTDANARQLKGLLQLYLALPPRAAQADEATAIAGAQNFTSGEDRLKLYRQLYVAAQLLRANVAAPIVTALMEDAPGGVESAVDTPVAVAAAMADQVSDLRAQALVAGTNTEIPAVGRETLARILRGRIEDAAGWSLERQSQLDEAIVRYKRALSVLPEGTSWWRATEWRLGAVYELKGQPQDALAAYLKGYNRNAPNALQRGVIERLWRQTNGSLQGLDEQIGVAPQP